LSGTVLTKTGEMSMKRYVVNLEKEEKEHLEQITSKGTTGVRKFRRAQTLLSANEGCIDKQIAQVLGTSVSTVERVRKRFVEEGLEASLTERPRIGGALQRKLDGHQEAYLLALAASDPPEGSGKRRWSMRMLAERLVEVGIVEEISGETVRRKLHEKGAPNLG
jgi:transposase